MGYATRAALRAACASTTSSGAMKAPPPPSSSYDALRQATPGEIVAEIGEHLAEINGNMADWRKAHRAMQAQMLLQELGRRDLEQLTKEQRRQSMVMVRCTVIITVLTVVITVLTAVTAWVTIFPPAGHEAQTVGSATGSSPKVQIGINQP